MTIKPFNDRPREKSNGIVFHDPVLELVKRIKDLQERVSDLKSLE
jgi:hypothetical protein